jgi:hypothetical protein
VFNVGDTLSIIASPGREVDGYDLSDSYKGLVRIPMPSLMGAYSVSKRKVIMVIVWSK